jgi:hypothetical protein
MTPLRRLTVIALIVVGVADLIGVPFMLAANHHKAGSVPGAAIVLGVIITVLTLVGAVGLARASRWAWWLSLIVRIPDLISSALGVGAHPTVPLAAGGAFCVVVSVIAFVLLFRLRREERQGLSAQSVGRAAARV